MFIYDMFDVINLRLGMEDILNLYHIKTNKSGFTVCPFHNEKTASFKAYKKSFYCFGCGISGDIVDFVVKKENCDTVAALKIIDNSFNLNLFAKKSLKDYRQEGIRLKKLKDACDKLRQKSYEYQSALRAYSGIKQAFKTSVFPKEQIDEYENALYLLAELEMYLDDNENYKIKEKYIPLKNYIGRIPKKKSEGVDID